MRTHLVSGEHVPALSVGLRERPPGELQVKVKVVSRRVHELRLDEAEELGVVLAAAGETLARLPAGSTDTARCRQNRHGAMQTEQTRRDAAADKLKSKIDIIRVSTG